MRNGLTDQEHNREFTKFLQVHLFGLLAFIDRPNHNEHFPMASGVVIESEVGYVLLTVAHYLEDLRRWKEQERLNALFLLVHHESGICNPIPLNLEDTPASFSDLLDVGFMALNDAVVAEIRKGGGIATRRDTLSMSPQSMKSFYLVGHASAYCKIVRETIATSREDSMETAWKLVRPGDMAVAISKLQFDGNGSDPGTFRFIRDHSLFAIQSKQIRGATSNQKPTHLIATSAAVAIHVIDDYLQKITNSPD